MTSTTVGTLCLRSYFGVPMQVCGIRLPSTLRVFTGTELWSCTSLMSVLPPLKYRNSKISDHTSRAREWKRVHVSKMPRKHGAKREREAPSSRLALSRLSILHMGRNNDLHEAAFVSLFYHTQSWWNISVTLTYLLITVNACKSAFTNTFTSNLVTSAKEK